MLASREDINRKYLLCPSEFSYLSIQIAKKYHAQLLSESLPSFYLVKGMSRRYVICPVSKDAQTASNESDLTFFVDIIKEFLAALPDQNDRDYTLLLPLRLCRGFLKIPPGFPYAQREHMVIVELDLARMSFQVHDSQGGLVKRLYPDKLSEIAEIAGVKILYNYATCYHAYDVQSDQFSCGYYALAYLDTIIANGSSRLCKTIKLNIQKDYLDKREYFSQQGVPEYIAHIDGQLIPNIEAESPAKVEEQEPPVAVLAKPSVLLNRRKFSALGTSGLFAQPDYIFQFDAIREEGNPSSDSPARLRAREVSK